MHAHAHDLRVEVGEASLADALESGPWREAPLSEPELAFCAYAEKLTQTPAEMTEQDVKKGMAKQLPDYMIPARIEFRAELPRNINDKIDRKALVAELDSVIEAPSMETPEPQRQTERT